MSDLNAPNPVRAIALTTGTTTVTASAVVRDRFGNFVDLARTGLWTTSAPPMLTLTPMSGWVTTLSRGSGILGSADSARIIVTSGALLPDTAMVTIQFFPTCAPPVADPASGPYQLVDTVYLTSATPGDEI